MIVESLLGDGDWQVSKLARKMARKTGTKKNTKLKKNKEQECTRSWRLINLIYSHRDDQNSRKSGGINKYLSKYSAVLCSQVFLL